MELSVRGSAHAVFRNAASGVLFYGVTPPKLGTEPERVREIGRITLERLATVAVDGLILYDVDAESDRSRESRPFPFLPMMDPAQFLDHSLDAWSKPVVVYRAVGKYSGTELTDWLGSADPARVLTVLVGASSARQEVKTSLTEAYRLYGEAEPRPVLGGVLIAERHEPEAGEHLRMLRKQEAGCEFFVSQVCYDLDHTRNVLSDYAYTCVERGLVPRPVVVTLAPCGSAKTLDFMTWLGIDIPRWVRNEILFSEDPLAESYEQCLAAARVLIAFCRRLGLPFGINVESVTNRKVEIEAAVELAREVRGLLNAPGPGR